MENKNPEDDLEAEIVPLCTSDDPNDHQGDTCPIHEGKADDELYWREEMMGERPILNPIGDPYHPEGL